MGFSCLVGVVPPLVALKGIVDSLTKTVGNGCHVKNIRYMLLLFLKSESNKLFTFLLSTAERAGTV